MILNVSWVELEKVHVTFTNASLYIWNLLMWRFVKSHVMIYLCRIILHCVGFPTQLNISCDVFQSSHEDAVTFTNMPLHFQSLQYTISNVTWDDVVFLVKHLMWWCFVYVTICDHHMRWSWSCDVAQPFMYTQCNGGCLKVKPCQVDAIASWQWGWWGWKLQPP